MEKFNKYKHVHLITKWWLEDSELSALLKKDKGYKLPSEWIQDLEKSNAYIFDNGIGEIRDILLGGKSRESEIFYYSPNKKAEANIAGQLIGWCFSNGIKTVRIKKLEIREQIITEGNLQGLINLANQGVKQNERVDNKSTDISSTIGTTYTGRSTEAIPDSNTTSGTANVSTSTITTTESTSKTATTSPTVATTSTASKKPTSNDVHAKKRGSKRKKKQPEREGAIA